MTDTVDYYVSLVSPWAYLGGSRLAEIAQKHRAVVTVKPIDLGRILAASGGLPLKQRSRQRQAYRLVELRRWSRHLGLPLNLHPAYFPAPDQLAGCVVIAAAKSGADPLRLAQAILTAVWAEERNIADAGTLTATAERLGLNGTHLLAGAADPEVRATYDRYTTEAIERGIFGVPSYLYRDEIFWGQDRLDFLDRALAGRG